MCRARSIVVVTATVVCLAGSVTAAPAKASPAAAKPASPAAKGEPGLDKLTGDARRKELLIRYYLRVYAESLEHSDWITRAMAVISLSKIDDPRVTDMLLEVMAQPYNRARALAKRRARLAAERKKPLKQKLTPKQAAALLAGAGRSSSDEPVGSGPPPLWRIGNKVVQVVAWEALHARTKSLSPQHRKQWIAGTLKLARAGQFRGAMRASMLKLLAPQGPTPLNLDVFAKLFLHTNALDPRDVEILEAMRQVLARWRSPKLIKALILAMGKSFDDGPRADYLLRGLAEDVPEPAKQIEKGPDAMWKRMQKAWADWYNTERPEPAEAAAAKPYMGTSTLIPAAEKVDPKDDKWRKDLELPRLHLDQLDVTLVVDSTGSMKTVVEWVKRDVRKLLKAFALLSREPRVGVVLYRDHGDEYVTKLYPLTDNGVKLTRAIDDATAAGGDDVPEAVYDALSVALRKQRWSRSAKAVRVIVLVGDAPPHETDLPKIEKLVQAAAKKGFSFYCMKARTRHGSADLGSFDRIAEWGGGKSVWADFAEGSQAAIYKGTRSLHVAADYYSGSGDGQERPDRVILREVLRSILTQAYSDRVGPFTNVLLEYLETPVKEKRLPPLTEAEKERRRAGGGGGRKPGKPPKGPQDR